MSEYIEVGQPLQFTDPNTPTRVGEIVENVSDIYNIPSPRLGMQVFVKREKKSFVITSLKSKTIGGVDVPEAAVEAFEPVGAKSITWNNDSNPSNMNDFVVAGVYDIKGERTRIDDNLPILNTGGGHTFHARLEVLDSSISGSGKDDDKCITQVLSFSNRLGQGEVYIRTGKGSSLDNLTWEKWSTIQRNVNVGEVTSLDHLIDNGIYSGIWREGSFAYVSYPFTFVCVVINDYFLGGSSPRKVSQFVYGVSALDGTTQFKYRVKIGNDNWSDWEILNKNEINSMITDAVDAATKAFNSRIDNLIDGAPETLDTLKEIADWVNTHEDLYQFLESIVELNTQAIEDEKTRAENAEKDIKRKAVDVETLNASELQDKVNVYFRNLNGAQNGFTIPAATVESAGVMSAADKVSLDNVVNDVGSLAVKKFYTLPAPRVGDDYYKKIEKVSLNILGLQDDFFRFEEKNLGNIERIFYAKDYGVQTNVPLHFVSYIYSEKEQETYYQLYEKNVGYLQNLIVHLKIGWNKLELEHTFETVTQNQLVVYLGKEANNDFYFYKTFVYNSIAKASVITEHTNDELAERLGKVEPTLKNVEVTTMGVTFYDNEEVVFNGNGKTYNTKVYSTPVVAGDVFVIKLEGITKPADSPDDSYLRFQFYDENNNQMAQQFFYANDTPVNTEITIPDGCVKLDYLFGLSVSKPSVLDGEYKWSGLTFKQLSRNDARFRNVETRVTELETLSNDWNGKVLTTYGDSVTALQDGDFSYPYNLTNSQKWGNRVADYFKMSKHYGRGIGGQKYAWGINGGAITWIEKATGKMIDRSDAYTLESWDGETFTSNVSAADRTKIINGLADGSVISIRGCACSWLRITSMYPASIKDSIDAVFVMFHNDSVDGKEFYWVEGDTTDPEWAASSYYATYGGDYNIETLEGGIASTIMKLQAWMPNAVIILGTPINGQGTTGQLRPDANGLYKQVQHVKNVGLRFSIPVIDVYATCGINGLNRTEYITDTIHPYSVAGSKMVARAVIGGFKTILPKL